MNELDKILISDPLPETARLKVSTGELVFLIVAAAPLFLVGCALLFVSQIFGPIGGLPGAIYIVTAIGLVTSRTKTWTTVFYLSAGLLYALFLVLAIGFTKLPIGYR